MRRGRARRLTDKDDGWDSDHQGLSDFEENDEELRAFMQSAAGTFIGGFLLADGLVDVGKFVRKYLPPGNVRELYEFYTGWDAVTKLPNKASRRSCA